jgi:hypothetical protein
MKKLLLSTAVLVALTYAAIAQSPSILQSLPPEVQKDIESVRARCREYAVSVNNQPNIPSDDAGLTSFTVSGAQAVMVNNLEICGPAGGGKGANYSNRGSYSLAIYVRSGNAWRKALSTEAVGDVFLSIDWLKDNKFKAMVLHVFSGNKDCPTHDVMVRNGNENYVFPAWKQSCAAVVKWDGTKFTYKPL